MPDSILDDAELDHVELSNLRRRQAADIAFLASGWQFINSVEPAAEPIIDEIAGVGALELDLRKRPNCLSRPKPRAWFDRSQRERAVRRAVEVHEQVWKCVDWRDVSALSKAFPWEARSDAPRNQARDWNAFDQIVRTADLVQRAARPAANKAQLQPSRLVRWSRSTSSISWPSAPCLGHRTPSQNDWTDRRFFRMIGPRVRRPDCLGRPLARSSPI